MTVPLQVKKLCAQARHEARSLGSPTCGPEHLLVAFLSQKDPYVVDLFHEHRIEVATLLENLRTALHAGAPVTDNPAATPEMASIAERAKSTRDVMMAFVSFLRVTTDSALLNALRSMNLSAPRLAVILERYLGDTPSILDAALKRATRRSSIPTSKLSAPATDIQERGTTTKKTLADALQIGRDLTQEAMLGSLPTIVGRHDEIKALARSLLRKQRSYPLLIGESGVGKTSIVHGFCHYVGSKNASSSLRDLKVIQIMPSSLVSGTRNRGDLEERVGAIVQAAETNPNTVLFLEDIAQIFGNSDLAALMKPAFAKGHIKCIGTTSPTAYQRMLQADDGLGRFFQLVRIEEPTNDETFEILHHLRPSYEEHHDVKITDGALRSAIDLSVKHLPDRRLPDKARDLVDQAAVNRRFQSVEERNTNIDGPIPTIDEHDVAEVVSEWTGIPAGKLTAAESDKLIRLEEALSMRVIGQDHAIEKISRVVRAARAGLNAPGKPHGVFLFLGPTGVGKTETARALADYLFDDESHLLRFDMSEYMEAHSVSKLIGAPPGYVGHDSGGKLTDAIRQNPYAVVLFDEVEKAHPKVADLFLQLFDEGWITDSYGRRASFSNAIVIMTSNLGVGASAPKRSMGFGAVQEEEDPARLRRALSAHFRPELLNRVSEVIRFRPLDVPDVQKIIEKMIASLDRRLMEKSIQLKIDQSAAAELLARGYDREQGAREMSRTIERAITHPIAEQIIGGQVCQGDHIVVSFREGNFRFSHEKDELHQSPQPPTKEADAQK